mgnify:CR=1 FL=1
MKVATDIPGLDKLMDGGFEEGSINLISGKTGTGKSVFCLQFLFNGVTSFGEKGLYVTTEETEAYLKKQALQFGWDFSELEKKGLVKIVAFEPFDIDTLTTKITEQVNLTGAKRVVIDSVSMFELYISEAYRIRKSIFKFLQKLKEMDITSIVTAEIPEDSNALSRFGVIEFLVDAVIVLQYMTIAKYKRSLMIRKMRTSKHSMNIHPFEITSDGIHVMDV